MDRIARTASRMADELMAPDAETEQPALATILERVDVGVNRLELRIARPHLLRRLLGDQGMVSPPEEDAGGDQIVLAVP